VDTTRKKSNRSVGREPAREVTYVGRDGKPLTRKLDIGVNPFEVPEQYREERWDYQWCRSTCFGKPDDANINRMQDTGWRPVMRSQMPGFMTTGRETGSDGAIEHEGLVLMERPLGMTEEAREEHRRENARLEQQQYQKFDMAAPKGSHFETRRDQRRIRKGKPEAVDMETYPELRHAASGARID
jgi:hypothetical protein